MGGNLPWNVVRPQAVLDPDLTRVDEVCSNQFQHWGASLHQILAEECLKVLLVDDEPTILELQRAWLQDTGFQVYSAGNGYEALDAVEKEPIDVVVTDQLMPGMSGLALLRTLRAPGRERSPYFILVTGDPDPGLLEKAFAQGADDFIRKPTPRMEFLTRVRAARRLLSLTQEITRRTEVNFDRRLVEASALEFREVVSTLAHDLRTPIGALRTTAESLVSALDGTPPQLARMAARIETISIHLAETVRDVTDAFVCDDPDGPRWEEFDLVEETKAAADLVRSSVHEGVEFVLLRMEPQRMFGNPLGIRRMCINAMTNATRATTKGRIIVGIDPDPDDARWIRIRITDTGGGIPSEILPFLGQPLALSHGASRRKFSANGSGLGLAICRRVAARHGGRIRIESSPGKGTGIEFRLRRDLPEARQSPDFAPMDAMDIP